LLSRRLAEGPQSALDRRYVVGKQPLVALLDAVLAPLPVDVGLRAVPTGERRIVEALGVLSRTGHHPARPVAARVLVTCKRRPDVAAVPLEAAREDKAVLDRHHRSLPKRRQRRMAGVAEQAHVADGPTM